MSLKRLILLGCLIAPTSLWAQSITLETGTASDDLRSDIAAASLTLALRDEDAPAPQDIVAAARADYRRILTALYKGGYYGDCPVGCPPSDQ